jgi:hypothetical protein
MRTTLTIDNDVAVELERLRRERNTKFKALVNEVLRNGLRVMNTPAKDRKPFYTRSFDCGRLLVDNLDKVWDVLEQVEDEKSR